MYMHRYTHKQKTFIYLKSNLSCTVLNYLKSKNQSTSIAFYLNTTHTLSPHPHGLALSTIRNNEQFSSNEPLVPRRLYPSIISSLRVTRFLRETADSRTEAGNVQD